MRKILLILSTLLLALLAAATLLWTFRESVAAHMLSRKLHVPVTIQTLDLTKTSAEMAHLWIGNPPHSKSSAAFTAERLAIGATLSEVLGSPLTIDAIEIDNIFIGIEIYGHKNDTNWSYILKEDRASTSKKDYLIRKLSFRNLTVEVTGADGRTKRYPTIQHMEFRNISSQTGFPLSEIEKAIFNLMMKDLFKKLNLDQLIDSLNPLLPASSPVKIPNPFKSKP
jgi:hypothetical protein